MPDGDVYADLKGFDLTCLADSNRTADSFRLVIGNEEVSSNPFYHHVRENSHFETNHLTRV